MTTQLELFRPVVDGASESALLVQSNGVIWHANEAARRLFNFVDGKGISVSTYLSFSTTRFPGRETLRLSWADVTSPDSFVESKQSVDGVGTCANGNRFPVTISLVRISNENGVCSETTNGGQRTSSDHNETDDSLGGRCFYCLYVQDLTPARLQLASLEEEINRLSAVKDAVIDASGQSLIVVDQRGCIISVGKRVAEIFGYDRNDSILNQNISVLMQEMGGNLDLSDHRRREVEGHHSSGDTIELEVGLAGISSNRGHTAIMIRDVTHVKESQRKEALNDRISRGLRERSFILDAAFDPLFCTNQTGIIFMVNQAAVNEFGWSRGEFIGQNVSMIVGGCHRHRHDSYMQRYMQTGEKRMIGKRREIQARRKDGTEFVAELGLAEISHPGEDKIFCGFIRNLTEQKIYERKLSVKMREVQEISRELQENQSIMLGILDASFHALFVITEKCTIRMVNKMSCEVFGWTKEEFIGKNINIIMPSNVASKHDGYVKEYLRTGVKKMIGTQREITAQRKDGSTFPCVLGLAETQDSGLICGFIRDLTSEKQAQARLDEEQKLMKKMLNSSSDAVFLINDQGIIQLVNSASTLVLGWSQEEFLGKNISMIMPENHAKNHDKYTQHYLKTGFKKMIGKEREVEALRKDGSTFPCILGLTEIIHDNSRLFVGFVKDVTIQKSLLIAEAEREASDSLLHNILPEHIAERLKQDPSHIADHYDNTTILFADIVGFTDRTSVMSPHEVVSILNDLFSRFDHLVGVYDLNKVKTIGDCYMVTSIPSDELEHDGCARVCRFSLDLMRAVQAFNLQCPQHGHIRVRVGIATGEVVAGIVGTKRFLFDMWGDAVNVAARMEQNGLPDQIQVTREVVDKAGNDFTFEFRANLNIKGKGPMDTYLLKSAKEFSLRRSAYQDVPHTPGVWRSKSTLL